MLRIEPGSSTCKKKPLPAVLSFRAEFSNILITATLHTVNVIEDCLVLFPLVLEIECRISQRQSMCSINGLQLWPPSIEGSEELLHKW